MLSREEQSHEFKMKSSMKIWYSLDDICKVIFSNLMDYSRTERIVDQSCLVERLR